MLSRELPHLVVDCRKGVGQQMLDHRSFANAWVWAGRDLDRPSAVPAPDAQLEAAEGEGRSDDSQRGEVVRVPVSERPAVLPRGAPLPPHSRHAVVHLRRATGRRSAG